MTLPSKINGVDSVFQPEAETGHVHIVLLFGGTSEDVDPECATSCRYIDQGLTEEYNANPIGAIERNVITANTERIVTFFISPLPQFI
jgi:hypothetical protein